MQKGYNLYNVEPQFRKFLAAENISAISLKNYLSDFRHFAAWLDFYLSSHSVIPRDHSVILSEAKDPDAGIIVSVLTPEILSEYRGYLVENKFTHKTINRRLSTVRRFCSFCISQGWLKENPAKKISNIGQNFSSLPLKIDGVESKKEAPQGPISSILGAPSTILDTPRVILKAVKNLVKRKPPVIPSLSRDLAKRESSFTLGIQHYIGLIIILVFMATLGAGIYTQFFAKSQPSLAYPTALTRAGRLLSFQGRLTDSLGNPITTATNVTYKLYSVSTGGTALYTAGACSTTPDQDGIFSTLIGGSGYSPTPPQDVCGSEIDSSVFSENANVYLGVTVASDSEMTPRQQIANVGYAINEKTLQGFPPGTGFSNIPYIDYQGNVIIATSAAGIRNSWASTNFTLSSSGIITVQSAGTGDVALSATESGNITATTGQGTTLFNVLTGNLKVGNGTPGVSLDGEDAYIEGTLEVDGATTLDGALDVASTIQAGSSNITLTLSTGYIDADALSLYTPALDGASLTTGSPSGLEVVSDELTLLQGCADNEILKWDETEDDWNCEVDAGGNTAWDDIADPDAAAGIAMAEYAQTLDWNTGSTAATFNGLSITLTNDASTDITTQYAFVIDNLDDGGSTGTTESLLVLDNSDTNEAVTDGLLFVSPIIFPDPSTLNTEYGVSIKSVKPPPA